MLKSFSAVTSFDFTGILEELMSGIFFFLMRFSFYGGHITPFQSPSQTTSNDGIEKGKKSKYFILYLFAGGVILGGLPCTEEDGDLPH